MSVLYKVGRGSSYTYQKRANQGRWRGLIIAIFIIASNIRDKVSKVFQEADNQFPAYPEEITNILGIRPRAHLSLFVTPWPAPEGRRMIRITLRCLQRTPMLPFPYINNFSIISSVSRIRRLPHRYSTSDAPMTHGVDIPDPQPTVSLSSGDGISSSSSYNALCADICKGLNPYKYTSGRWLRRDKLERDSRSLSFNFDVLRQRVIELCPGASSIARYEKKEGGYNRVFVFTCDNGRRVVARLPTSVAGPARLTTNSEVATITYGKLETSRTKLSS